MRVLLDTHVLLWAILDPPKLSTVAAAILADVRNEALLSAASVWEIGNKVRLGKLPIAEALEKDLLQTLKVTGYALLPIDGAVALAASRLVGVHRDPFDRFIAAQALLLDVALLSVDASLDGFGVRRIW